MVQFLERLNCVLCKADLMESLLSEEYDSETMQSYLLKTYPHVTWPAFDDVYEVLRCKRCKMVQQKYILDEEGMRKLYEEWISPEESMGKVTKFHLLTFLALSKQLELVARLFNKPPSDISVLDFGMGWGTWCQMAMAFGCKTYGFEFASSRKKFAQESGIQIINSMDQIPVNTLDFINLEQVLEHLPKPLETLILLNQALHSKGVIRLAVPNGARLKLKNAISKGPVQPFEHINCFTNKTLKKMAQEAGLKPIKPPFIHSEKNALESLLRAFLKRHYQFHFDTVLFFQKQ